MLVNLMCSKINGKYIEMKSTNISMKKKEGIVAPLHADATTTEKKKIQSE